MKSFKEYLLEEESSNHLDFISQKVSTIGYQKGKPNIPKSGMKDFQSSALKSKDLFSKIEAT